MLALKLTLIVICSYFIGNINAAVIISKLSGNDIRKSGSGNPGTMNMVRTFGKKLGVLTLLIDALKAMICASAALLVMEQIPFVADNNLGAYVAGIAVTAGHIFPVFMKFKGGKGIACIIGVSLVVNPLVMLITFAAGLLIIIFTKIGTFGTFFMIFAPLIYDAVILGDTNLAASILIFVLVSLSLFAHRENIIRLFRGRENLTYLFKKKPKEKPESTASSLK